MYKIGFGFDAHKFSEGRKLVLGGLEIPFGLGLSGHSDADVLTHAICDALLGALGEGDIGSLFPDSDPRYKGVSSLSFLSEILRMLNREGYEVENVDSVIVCEKPRIAPHVQAIKDSLSQIMGLPGNRIGVKATTTDRMGFTGRGEGIAAYAIALIKSTSFT
ncbi:MAG: 2-C-methyl-D-erythritol 2,4-cyclodiphosphate synthase [Thermodesulfobacteriota bacterium]